MGRLSEAPQLSCMMGPISNLRVNEVTSLLGSHSISDMQIGMPPASRGLPRNLPENSRASAPNCPRAWSPAECLLRVWLGTWACSSLSSCHTALSRTFVWLQLNLVERNVNTHHCTEICENRVFEPAPTPYVREYSTAVSTRADVLLYAPVDVLDRVQ